MGPYLNQKQAVNKMAHHNTTSSKLPVNGSNEPLSRLQAAKAALAAAENKQGLRPVITSGFTQPTGSSGNPTYTLEHTRTLTKNPFTLVPNEHASQQTKTTDALRPNTSTETPDPLDLPPASAQPTASAQQQAPTLITREDREHIPVHPALNAALPHGLTRGAITTTHGSTYLALTLITQHTKNGGWVAIVGAPNINYVTLQDLDANLNNIIAIPHPGEKTPEVIAALIEGTDLILLGPNITLTAGEQRTLAARNRERGTHIITQTPWKGARTHLAAQHHPWHGTNHGLGRLTSTSYTITTTRNHQQHSTHIATHNGVLMANNAHVTDRSPVTDHTLTPHTSTHQTYRKEKTG